MVYTRIGYGGFDNGVRVNKPSYTLKIEPGLVYSFKVTAVNHGGESFPSEILSAYKAKQEHARVLIINGFNRLSGPAVIDTPDLTWNKTPVSLINTIFHFAGHRPALIALRREKKEKEVWAIAETNWKE